MSVIIADEKVKEHAALYADINERVKRLLIERLNLPYKEDEIADDSALFGLGLGLDSVDALEIACSIEQEFGIRVRDEDMMIFRSIMSITDFVVKNRKTQPLSKD
jgi:acyl carrier protein